MLFARDASAAPGAGRYEKVYVFRHVNMRNASLKALRDELQDSSRFAAPLMVAAAGNIGWSVSQGAEGLGRHRESSPEIGIAFAYTSNTQLTGRRGCLCQHRVSGNQRDARGEVTASKRRFESAGCTQPSPSRLSDRPLLPAADSMGGGSKAGRMI